MIFGRPLLISAVLALAISLYSGNASADDAEDFIEIGEFYGQDI